MLSDEVEGHHDRAELGCTRGAGLGGGWGGGFEVGVVMVGWGGYHGEEEVGVGEVGRVGRGRGGLGEGGGGRGVGGESGYTDNTSM